MSTVVLVVRLILVGVFALAGVAKLMDLAGSREAVEGFGVSARMAGAVGTLVPFAEIAVAGALLPTPSARWGAIGAAVLLAGFSAGVARALSHGLAPDCNCFGQVASEPVSPKTLWRNCGLAALALVVAIAGPGSALSSWTSNDSVADVVAALATVTAAVLATVLYARRGATLSNAAIPAVDAGEAIALGTPAPDFELPDLDGTPVSLRQILDRGRPVVLVFASATCPPCRQLLPHIAHWNRAIGNDVTVVVVESGWREHQLQGEDLTSVAGLIVLTERDRDLAVAYRTAGTPTGISLTADGLISSPPMPGSGQVERLIRQVLETGHGPGGTEQPADVAVSA